MSVNPPTVIPRPRVTSTELQYYWSPPETSGNQLWVAVGSRFVDSVYYTVITTSTDGVTWTDASNNPFSVGDVYGIGWNGSYWLAAGSSPESSIAKSTDGMTWVDSVTAGGNNPLSSVCYRVVWNGSYWLACGTGFVGEIVVAISKSSDGINWTDASNNPFTDGECRGLAWNGSYWVAVGGNAGYSVTIAKSTDGMTWTDASNNPFPGVTAKGIAWSATGSIWVAIADAGSVGVATSTDGVTWTAAESNPFGDTGSICNEVSWNGSYFLIIGKKSNTQVSMLTSTNGITWTPGGSSSANPFHYGEGYGISWNGSYWIAVGDGLSSTVGVAKSTDGTTWVTSVDASGNNPFIGGSGFSVANSSSEVTGYILESVSPSITQTVGPTTTAIITGLTPLTDYSFTIKTNIRGTYSSTVPFRTVRTSNRPAPVSTLTKSQSIVNGLINVTFSWTNPTDYAYYYAIGLRLATGTKDSIYIGTSDYATLSHTFTGLDPSRTYTFNIKRGNDGGYSSVTSISTSPVYFNPTTVDGLHFWVDAADVSGNGSNVADGTVISSWKDKSGTSNHATSTGGATLRTDSVGRYLDFTGTNWYSLTESSWAYGEYFTFFVVDRPVDYSGSYTLISNQAASTDSLIISYVATNSFKFSTNGDNASIGGDYSDADFASPVNIWCFTNYGGKTAYYNKQVSGKVYTATAFITDSLLSIGAVEGSTDKYTGRIREIMMYSGIMSEGSREAITTYLFNKWFTQPDLIPLLPVQNSTTLWLDAQDIDTFFQDVSGTVPVTTNAQTSLLWKDKSGFGHDMIATIVSPTYSTNAINSYPAFNVPLDSSGNIQTNAFAGSGDATFFIVFKAISTDINSSILQLGFGLSVSDSFFRWIIYSANNNIFSATQEPLLFYCKIQKRQIVSATYITASGNQSSYSIENLSTAINASGIQLFSSNPICYGEVIYYNRALTDTEIQTNATYLSNKWRFTLPITAPFTPKQISGLDLWLDSSDPYMVFQNSGVLTAWKDKSGNGYNAVPHGSPTVNNGVVFDGSGQWLSLPDSSLPQNSYSYYIVSKLTGDSAIINGGSHTIGGASGGQKWVAVGYNSSRTVCIATSTDGLAWTDSSNNPFSGGEGYAVAYNGIIWVAVGNNSDSTVCIAKSTNGMTWTNSTDNPFSDGTGFAIGWNGSYWLAGGTNGDTVCIAKSTDGMTWTPSSNNPFTNGDCKGVAWSATGSYWIAVGQNLDSTVCIAKSTDGMTWTPSSNNPFSVGARGIAWNGTYWIAVAWGPVAIAKSSDGMTWTDASNNPFSPYGDGGNGIAWSATGSYWIVVGDSGGVNCVAKSTDGMTWVDSSSGGGNSPFNPSAYSIAWNGSAWVAGGYDNIARSSNGLTWTNATNNPFSGGPAYGIGSDFLESSAVGITTIKATTIPTTNTYLAQTVFREASSLSALEDTNIIPNNTTVIIESLYDGAGKSLFLSGLTGETDTSIHKQDLSDNLIGKDLSGGYMNGTIKEILVYNTAHTTEQRQQVEKYLRNKWSPVGYTPSGTSLWLDSSSSANFTLSGSSIQVWKDKSAQGINFSQSYAWAQPIYSLDSVTSRYGVQFGADAIATGLINSATSPFGNTSSWSVFTVQRYDYSTYDPSQIVNHYVCTAYDISGNVPTIFQIGTTYTSTPSVSEIDYFQDDGHYAFTAEIHKRPVMTTQYVNNLEYADFCNGSAGLTTTLAQAMTTAARLNIGFTGALTPALAGAMRGYIYEIVVFNTAITTEVRQSVEGYLAWKWGISDLLPSTHPYYLSPP